MSLDLTTRGATVVSPGRDWGDALVAHGPALRRVIRRHVADPFLVEDVLQETFARAIRNRASFDPARPLMPWLATLARRAAADALGRASARRETPAPDVDAGVAPEPGDELDRREVAAAVGAALAGLCPRDRRLLWLTHYEELSAREASDRERVGYHNFTSALGRARARFRSAYTDVAGARGLLAGLAPVAWARRQASRSRAAADALSALGAPAAAAVAVALAGAAHVPVAAPSTGVVMAAAPATLNGPGAAQAAVATPPPGTLSQAAPAARAVPARPRAGSPAVGAPSVSAPVTLEADGPGGAGVRHRGEPKVHCRPESIVATTVCAARGLLPNG